MPNDESKYKSLMAYLPYSELSDRVEEALSDWLSNPTNLGQFKNGESADWMITAHVSIAGEDTYGFKVRMQSNGQVCFRGRLRKNSAD